MISLLSAAATVLAAYNCQLEPLRAVTLSATGATASEIGLPPMALRFTISIEDGNPLQARVAWSGDPMQAAGKFPAVTTAPGAYAFSAYSSGPCLFTEQACLTQFNLVDGGDQPAHIILTPVAVTTDRDKGARHPFAAIALGQCTRTDTKK